MGLDYVELVMDVEDDFGVHFEADEMAKIRTVGHLFELVQLKLAKFHLKSCPSLRVFNELRGQMMELFNTPRCAVRMDTRLDDLLPRERRQECWKSLSQRTGFHLPPLVPRKVSLCANRRNPMELAGWMLTAMGAMFALQPGLNFSQRLFWLFLALSFGFLWMKALELASFLANAYQADFPPEDYETIRQMVRSIVDTHFTSPSNDSSTPENNLAWRRLVRIVSEQLNVPIGEIRRESRFVEDLRCG